MHKLYQSYFSCGYLPFSSLRSAAGIDLPIARVQYAIDGSFKMLKRAEMQKCSHFLILINNYERYFTNEVKY